MKEKLFMPPFLKNEAYMRQRFGGLQADNRSYYANSIALAQLDFEFKVRKLGGPVDQAEWDEYPQRVNAFYSDSSNEMIFPAAVFSPPFLDVSLPVAMAYGSTGWTIGHELTHGFDSYGSNYDADGKLKPSWTKATKNNFQKLSECYVKQYSQYKSDTGKSVNGRLTLDENIADNGGLRLAWNAYKAQSKSKGPKFLPSDFAKMKLNQDQLFFLSFAQAWCAKDTPAYADQAILTDLHSPARVRVEGSLANFPEFHQAFQCKAPEKTCQLW